MCGMTRAVDIKHAISLGVDAIGLIFYPQSTRCLSVEQAKIILKNLSPFVDVVAVFVNPDVSLVQQVMTELPVQWLQFHGDETAVFCEQFDLPYIKAIQAASTAVITQATQDYEHAAAILLDTPSLNRGGSGVPFDWQIIPHSLEKPIILAGGLDAVNVGESITVCAPYAVDACSGVEASAGIKDHVKMEQFVKAIWERT